MIKFDSPEGDKKEHIGLTTEVRLRGFNGDRPIPGKVDTGAETSSLHASDLQVVQDDAGDHVAIFTFSGSKYRVPVSGFQAVSSADGGVTNRPVVKFNTYIADHLIPDVSYNLNDRSQMEFELLIGMNLITAAKLKVDPSLKEMELEFSAPVEGGIDPGSSADEVVDKSSEQLDDSTQLIKSFEAFLETVKDMTAIELIQKLIGYNKETPTNVTED